jgi:hypothetical protein
LGESRPQVSGDWHASIDTTSFDPGLVCFIQASTAGGTCQAYCASLGRICVQGQDDDGGCGVQDERGQFTLEQDGSSNGCNQQWGAQICGCKGRGLK